MQDMKGEFSEDIDSLKNQIVILEIKGLINQIKNLN
jgi:hypothetical protein